VVDIGCGGYLKRWAATTSPFRDSKRSAVFGWIYPLARQAMNAYTRENKVFRCDLEEKVFNANCNSARLCYFPITVSSNPLKQQAQMPP